MTPGARRRRRPGNDEHRVGCARMAADRDERALVIVGGGRMGEALLAGILAAGRPADELAVAEVSPTRREELAAAHAGGGGPRAGAGGVGGRAGGGGAPGAPGPGGGGGGGAHPPRPGAGGGGGGG